MKLKRIVAVRALAGGVFALLALNPGNITRLTPFALAQGQSAHSACIPVGGALITNIGAIAGVTNLGPVWGDLSGSVAATILGQNSNGSYNVQHYWVTAAGDTITLKVAVLTPTYPTSDRASWPSPGETTDPTYPEEPASLTTPRVIWITSG